MAKATRKAARKASPPKARGAAKRKAPAKASKPKAATRTTAQPRQRAARPTCPICGARDVEVAKSPAKAKAPQKPAAGVVRPFLVEHHAGLVCHSCGYREEAA